MKRNVIVFGLISGVIITALMIAGSLMCYNNPEGFEPNMVLGYAAMLAAFSFVFVGIKNYRDKYNNGIISFARAFKTGFLIAVVASTMYVVVWLIEYYVFIPDFLEHYADFMLTHAKENGATATELNAAREEIEMYKKVYSTPIGVIAMTYVEVLPIGTVVTLISALILKRKK